MKIHRFFLNSPLRDKGIYNITDEELLHQIRTVLRLSKGEKITLINEGRWIIGTLVSIEPKKINVLLEENEPLRKTSRKVSLFVSVLKKDSFEQVVQKATECGVSVITPLLCERTIKQSLSPSRLLKIAQEASEQCGRVSLPTIHEPIPFPKILPMLPQNEACFFLDLDSPLHAPSPPLLPSAPISFFVGPEGGWTENERTLAEFHKLEKISLSPFVLRAETAAILGTFFFSKEKE